VDPIVLLFNQVAITAALLVVAKLWILVCLSEQEIGTAALILGTLDSVIAFDRLLEHHLFVLRVELELAALLLQRLRFFHHHFIVPYHGSCLLAHRLLRLEVNHAERGTWRRNLCTIQPL